MRQRSGSLGLSDSQCLLGFALRSLGASFNGIAARRREGIVRGQSQRVQDVLQTTRPGFDQVFNLPLEPLLAVASQAQGFEIQQLALDTKTPAKAQAKQTPKKRSGNSFRQRRRRFHNKNRNLGKSRNQPSDKDVSKKGTPKKDKDNHKKGDGHGKGKGRGDGSHRK